MHGYALGEDRHAACRACAGVGYMEGWRKRATGFEIPGVVRRRDPQHDAVPLVLDSPHSGAHYPEEFAYRCPLPMLRRAEDAYVDELYEAAPAHGATLIAALFPRSYIDVEPRRRRSRPGDPDAPRRRRR